MNGDQIQDGTIDGNEIQNNSFTAADLAADNVGDSELKDDIDIKIIHNGGRTTTSKNHYAVKVNDTLWIRKNLYVDGETHVGTK